MGQQTSERRVQVVMSWGGTPQGSVEIGAAGRIVIGEGPSSFLLPAELVPGGSFALVEGDGLGGFVLRVPEGASLIADRDGVAVDASERALPIDRALRAAVDLGAFTFFVQEVDPVTEKTPMARPDFVGWRWAAVSLVAHCAFLASLLFMPPNAGALSLDLTQDQRDYVRIRLDAMAREREVIETPRTPDESGGALSGSPTSGEEGAAGAPEEARHTGGGIRVRGPRHDDARVPLTRDAVATAGVLSVFGAFTQTQADVTSPYGAADAVGFAEDSAYGALMQDVGFSSGPGGLAMRGVGRGGGCQPGQPCGAGTIGQGALGTGGFGTTCTTEDFTRIERAQGHAAAVASCSPGTVGRSIGTGRPSDRGHESRVPSLSCVRGPDGQCAVATVGGLSREQIRLVVSRNRGQVRHCYEAALQQRPDLGGRVSVRWTIHPEGRVLSAEVATGTDLHSSEVEQCVVRAVQRWQFPSSQGPTAVTYPFVFQSAD